ncbi:hypothetical protein GOP47_0015987 [Adiantum capillus-veneris]|uniref:Uncharacterized protein n=1 Tax=Adiantum capillus-veneris TaxID=13818 RepID=A0A9D4ZEH3_ADICA|nr:hypothetical protein GOP47_0015987 [Adiantum capillus-veneris]
MKSAKRGEKIPWDKSQKNPPLITAFLCTLADTFQRPPFWSFFQNPRTSNACNLLIPYRNQAYGCSTDIYARQSTHSCSLILLIPSVLSARAVLLQALQVFNTGEFDDAAVVLFDGVIGARL